MAKQAKRTKKFIKNNLDRTIKDRRERQKKKATIERSHAAKKLKARHNGVDRGPRRDSPEAEDDGASDQEPIDDEEDAEAMKAMSVEDFLGGGFKGAMSGDEDEDGSEASDDGSEGGDDMEELDDLSDDEGTHMQDLAKLAQKDPEFYKYLQENDKELLQFGAGGDSDDDDEVEEDEDEEEPAPKKAKGKSKAAESAIPVLTIAMLKEWQKAMLRHRSLKAWRRLLLAFRSAVRMDEEEGNGKQASAFVVNDADVFSKVLLTTLKYTPMIIQHHAPYKELANGKYKLPTNTKKFAALQKPIKTYFSNLHHLLRTLPEPQMIYVAMTESARMAPYLLHNKRQARDYVKIALDLWATSEDSVRIASFLAVRRLAAGGDETMLDICLRGAYQALIRSSKQTAAHTLANINLMKNSASELYALDLGASYQHAFSFIRQLAIHLRNAMKLQSKDSHRNICNWQYVHCLDFWSLVLSKTCDVELDAGESVMQPLIYPLVQVATGAIKLVPQSRFYPMRLHVARLVLRIMQRTKVYVPIAPYLLEIFEASEFQRKAKPSSLKPLHLDTTIRAPSAYQRTRVYAEQLAEETTYILTEFLATQARSIAFPELVVPVSVQLKRSQKTALNPKLGMALKPLLHKIQQNREWISQRRSTVTFAPQDRRQVVDFLRNEKGEAPLEAAVRLARKVREQKKKLLEQTAQEVEVDDDEETGDEDDGADGPLEEDEDEDEEEMEED